MRSTVESFMMNVGLSGFMIQGGDPAGTGRGGESIYGGKFEDEITSNLKFTGAGFVAMRSEVVPKRKYNSGRYIPQSFPSGNLSIPI